MTERPPLLDSVKFAKALEAAGIIHDPRRIVRIILIAEPGALVIIHAEYVADERLLPLVPTLTDPEGTTSDH